MDTRPRPDARDDAELVRAATAGDRGAFAAIYDRYADRLHDFCWSVLRDRDEAADATQDAFLVAAERLGQLRDLERLRAVAVRGGAQPGPPPGPGPIACRARGGDDRAARPRHRPRAGGRALGPARAGLERRRRPVRARPGPARPPPPPRPRGRRAGPGHGRGARPRLRPPQPPPRPGRALLGALLVARLGRDDCPDLAAILSGWDGRFTP